MGCATSLPGLDHQVVLRVLSGQPATFPPQPADKKEEAVAYLAEQEEGITDLHRAAMDADFSRDVSTQLSADPSLDVNAEDIQGNTPLHLACKFLNIKAACSLIAHKADVTKKNHAGETPQEAAPADHPSELDKLFPPHEAPPAEQ